jgi:hypothetical protein
MARTEKRKEQERKALEKKVNTEAMRIMDIIETERQIEGVLEEQKEEYHVRVNLFENKRYHGTVWSESSGITFTTKTYTKKTNVANDILVFIKLFLDFTMSKKNCDIIKNIKPNTTETLYVH